MRPYWKIIVNNSACNFLCALVYSVWVVLLQLSPQCEGRSTTRPEELSDTEASRVVDFLTKYGYLPPSELQTSSNLRAEDRLRDAIRTMQRFGNIPQTGHLDDATVELVQKRRCGVPDIMRTSLSKRAKRYSIQGQKWSNTNITWTVKVPLQKTDLRMVRSQLSKAFAMWSEASVLTFTEVKGQKADIVVSFLHGPHGDGYPFDGEGAVLAHAFFPGEGIGGDAHFDAEERWLSQPPSQDEEGVNFFAVAAHEIGHSLGLSHASTPGSLMFPYYQMVDGQFKLSDDDARGIQQLYGSKSFKSWEFAPEIYPTATTKSSFTSTTRKATVTYVNKIRPTKTTRRSNTVSPSKSPISLDVEDPPETCNTSIDAISVIRRDLFVFKGKYFWRMTLDKAQKRGYPTLINRFWYNLPKSIENIDAVYERTHDTKIVFFSGRQHWLFSGNQMVVGYPRQITDLGLPASLDKIDAAFVWGHNSKTYFFSGDQYWKYDEDEEAVELDYPRNISAWQGLPSDIDAAFQWNNGHTYFFQGEKFWKFDDAKMKVHSTVGYLNEFLFGCNNTRNITSQALTTPKQTTPMPNVLLNSTYDGQRRLVSDIVIVTICLLYYAICIIGTQPLY